MPTVLGIDVSTKAIDLVLLDESTNRCTWDHIPLAGVSAFDRLRDVPRRMPKWGWYEDQGVYLAAIELPMSRAAGSSIFKLNHVFGAVVACLPRALQTVWAIAPHEWRKELELAGNAPKQVCAARCVELGAYPEWNDQNAYDAFAVAYMARQTNQRGLEAA